MKILKSAFKSASAQKKKLAASKPPVAPVPPVVIEKQNGRQDEYFKSFLDKKKLNPEEDEENTQEKIDRKRSEYKKQKQIDLEKRSHGSKRKRFGPLGQFKGKLQVFDSFIQDEPSDDETAHFQEKQKGQDIGFCDSSMDSSQKDENNDTQDDHPLARYAHDKSNALGMNDSDGFEDYDNQDGGGNLEFKQDKKKSKSKSNNELSSKYYKESDDDAIQREIDANMGFDVRDFQASRNSGGNNTRKRDIKITSKKLPKQNHSNSSKQQAAEQPKSTIIETKRYFTPLKGELKTKSSMPPGSNCKWTETITIEEPESFDFVFKPAGLRKKEREEGQTMAAKSKLKSKSSFLFQDAIATDETAAQHKFQQPITRATEVKLVAQTPVVQKKPQPVQMVAQDDSKTVKSSKRRKKVVMVEVPEEEEDFDFCFKAEDDKAIIIPTKIQDQEALIDKDKDENENDQFEEQIDCQMIHDECQELLVITNNVDQNEEIKDVEDIIAPLVEPSGKKQSEPILDNNDKKSEPLTCNRGTHDEILEQQNCQKDNTGTEKKDDEQQRTSSALIPFKASNINSSNHIKCYDQPSPVSVNETVITLSMDGQFQSESQVDVTLNSNNKLNNGEEDILQVRCSQEEANEDDDLDLEEEALQTIADQLQSESKPTLRDLNYQENNSDMGSQVEGSQACDSKQSESQGSELDSQSKAKSDDKSDEINSQNQKQQNEKNCDDKQSKLASFGSSPDIIENKQNDSKKNIVTQEAMQSSSEDSELEFNTPTQDFELEAAVQDFDKEMSKEAEQIAKQKIEAEKKRKAQKLLSKSKSKEHQQLKKDVKNKSNKRERKELITQDQKDMIIGGCYFPDQSGRKSDNDGQEQQYRTFLDKIDKRSTKSKDRRRDKKKDKKDFDQNLKKHISDKRFSEDRSNQKHNKSGKESSRRSKPKVPTIWDQGTKKQPDYPKNQVHLNKTMNADDTSEPKQAAQEEEEFQDNDEKKKFKMAFGMDDLLVNSLNLTRDFNRAQYEQLDDAHHNEKLRYKMERHDNVQRDFKEAEGLFKEQNEIDSDEIENEVQPPNPEVLVGTPAPEHGKYAPVKGIYKNAGPDIFKADTAEINGDSDSCSAVSSNSDEEDISKSNRGSSDKNGFSSCSDDSAGKKQKLAKKAKAKAKAMNTEKDKQQNGNNMDNDFKIQTGDRVSKKYKQFVMKANKVLTTGRNQMVCWNFASRDSVKYCYLKAIDYYKKALKHCRSPRDKGRIYVLISQTQISLTPRLYERDQQSKSIQKAIFYLSLTLQTCSDFDHKIIGDMEESVRFLIMKQITEKYDQPELLCMVYEMIKENIHQRMTNIMSFIINELHKLYYKIACDIIEMRSDTQNATKYLNQCIELGRSHKIFENHCIAQKLEECKEIEEERKLSNQNANKKVNSRTRNHKARAFLDQGTKMLDMNSGLKEAIKFFRRCLHYAKDNDTEAECLANFHIGECLYKLGTDFESARAHLVNFQIFCQMKCEKSPDVIAKFKQASHLINQIIDKKNKENLERHKLANPKLYQKAAKKKAAKQSRPKLTTKLLLEEVEKSQSQSPLLFLKFLQSRFYEKTEKIKIGGHTRKNLLKFIGVFHPDKQNAATEISDRFRDVDMLKVSEEITKYLNLHLGRQ